MGKRSVSFKFCDRKGLQKFPCKACCRETNHKVISSYLETGSEEFPDGNSYDWSSESQIIQCVGCEDVSFRVRSSNSEEYDVDDDGQSLTHLETVKYYPGRAIGPRLLEHWYLPRIVAQIYQEARAAVEGELLIIGGIAIRALLEAVCKDVDAVGDNLFKKLDDLHAKSLATKEGVAALHKLRVLGNRAAHESAAHSQSQLLLALEVMEHILMGTYVIPTKVASTFNNMQDRQKKLGHPDGG